jgi:xanthine dehydrogenase accessory factor
MHDCAAIARTWQLERRRAVVASVVGIDGLGPRTDGELALIDHDGNIAGSLLGGALDASLAALLRDEHRRDDGNRIVGLDISTSDADSAGLTCAGHVDVLLQPLDTIPGELWDALADGRAVALATTTGTHPARTAVFFTDRAPVARLGESELDTIAEAEAEGLLAKPGNTRTEVRLGSDHVVIQSWNPVPHVVIVGVNNLARALTNQFDLLGWTSAVATTAEAAAPMLSSMTTGDIVLVLDHSPQIATPVLATALRAGHGYVGALGSRRTQIARRSHLERAGLTQVEIDRLHGPAGLDLGGRTPAETAISIAAEIVAYRSGRSAQSLHATSGRISA